MKLNKSNMKKILILLLTVFLLVPIVLMFLGHNQIHEPYDGYVNDNTKIQALDINGLNLTDGGDISYTGVSGEKLYCIGGNLSCIDGYVPHEKGTDTYNHPVYECKNEDDDTVDNSKGRCRNSVFTGSNQPSYINLYSYDADGLAIRDVSYNLQKFSYDGTTAVDEESKYNGFTNPFEFLPLEFSGENNEYLIMNKDTSVKYSSCLLYHDSVSCGFGAQDSLASPPDHQPGDDLNELSCVADYGSKVGESLCCGQTGVVQKDSRKCPYELPVCSGYVCGQKWGRCQANE